MLITDDRIIHFGTLNLLKRLQTDTRFDSFFLVGGTALALHIGHRLSIDLDFFSRNSFDTSELQAYLTKQYGFYTDYVANDTLKGFIEQVKVDFIAHSYPLVKDLVIEEPIRLASLTDIAAMKLNAIAFSGNRQKDFYDVFFLLEHLNFRTMLDAFATKYPKSNPLIPLKAITYFEDIDFGIEYPQLLKPASFLEVQDRLIEATVDVQKVFK